MRASVKGTIQDRTFGTICSCCGKRCLFHVVLTGVRSWIALSVKCMHVSCLHVQYVFHAFLFAFVHVSQFTFISSILYTRVRSWIALFAESAFMSLLAVSLESVSCASLACLQPVSSLSLACLSDSRDGLYSLFLPPLTLTPPNPAKCAI